MWRFWCWWGWGLREELGSVVVQLCSCALGVGMARGGEVGLERGEVATGGRHDFYNRSHQ